MDLETLYLELEKKEGFESGTGASSEEIAAAQEALELEFPWEYRAFLSKYSYAFWSGHYVAGIIDCSTMGVVSHTLSQREGGFCAKAALVLDTDYQMFCRDPEDYLIKGGVRTYSSFSDWLNYKVSP